MFVLLNFFLLLRCLQREQSRMPLLLCDVNKMIRKSLVHSGGSPHTACKTTNAHTNTSIVYTTMKRPEGSDVCIAYKLIRKGKVSYFEADFCQKDAGQRENWGENILFNILTDCDVLLLLVCVCLWPCWKLVTNCCQQTCVCA